MSTAREFYFQKIPESHCYFQYHVFQRAHFAIDRQNPTWFCSGHEDKKRQVKVEEQKNVTPFLKRIGET